MKHLLIYAVVHLSLSTISAQGVGIGTIQPKAMLHVHDSAVIFSAVGDVPQSGQLPSPPEGGVGMVWYAEKAAFRASYLSFDETKKVGKYSMAIGSYATAVGEASLATGNSNATGEFSAALGVATASGSYSLGMGNSQSIGRYSVAGGRETTASGDYSTAFGFRARSNLNSSVALGNEVTASAYSIAIGNYATAAGVGSFAIGDRSTDTRLIVGQNQFRSRFAGGYRFYSNSLMTIGAVLRPDDNFWTTASDYRLKENFVSVDREKILQKVTKMRQYTWNYKGQDPHSLRHYGPMAQDFFRAFGRDALGSIGCDTIINQHDFSSVNFIAVQALEKRTRDQRITVQQMREENASIKKKNRMLEVRIARLERLVDAKH